MKATYKIVTNHPTQIFSQKPVSLSSLLHNYFEIFLAVRAAYAASFLL